MLPPFPFLPPGQQFPPFFPPLRPDQMTLDAAAAAALLYPFNHAGSPAQFHPQPFLPPEIAAAMTSGKGSLPPAALQSLGFPELISADSFSQGMPSMRASGQQFTPQTAIGRNGGASLQRTHNIIASNVEGGKVPPPPLNASPATSFQAARSGYSGTTTSRSLQMLPAGGEQVLTQVPSVRTRNLDPSQLSPSEHFPPSSQATPSPPHTTYAQQQQQPPMPPPFWGDQANLGGARGGVMGGQPGAGSFSRPPPQPQPQEKNQRQQMMASNF
uniref:Uncharacterized protein n=1 Tax=Chromera velia CCMP2878 TaxID=1169474 RepID=A0A0G4GZA5_9ALVE|eukprot:Cvel_23944.t1-p1 / transcript=Cvel_23944.t1 / gene=Cvel_23944 / organism=Chromera_velia_CCMP2878 / gene_product=hypothetical protein / transcript_product=hypothetical protein / location=Cvel_scaffold2531:5792-6601(-) / protein_length=270 / sequence_SO=supercontig / SO=protein_coding / is_pseudo=false